MKRTSAFVLLVLMMIAVGAMTIREDVAEDLHNLQNKANLCDPTNSLDELEEEYIRHIVSLVNAYKRKMSRGRHGRTWKRNVDLINSLLALPNKMHEAGR